MATSDDGLYDIYRFFNTQTGAHFFTSSESERDTVQNTLPQFSYEGNVFDSNAVEGATGSVPVYRFYNTNTGVHFYTASEDEKTQVESLPGFNFEGTSYVAYESSTSATETMPLYRFYNTQTGTHFYTVDEAEKDSIVANLPQYNFEGVAYYVGGPVEVQLDLTTTSGDAQTLVANTATSSSFKIGGGTGTPITTSGTDASTYWTVTGVEASDRFELTTTTGPSGGPGTNNQGDGGNGGVTFDFAPLTNSSSNTLSLTLAGGVNVKGGDGGIGGDNSFSSSRSGDGATAINASNFETLNITSTGSSANSILGGSAGSSPDNQPGTDGKSIVLATGATISVSGTQALDLGTLGGNGTTINAGSFEGNLSVIADSGNNTMTGGSGNDMLGGGNGQDTITLGGGSNFVVISDGVDVLLSNRATTTVTDFEAGSDKIKANANNDVVGNQSGAGSAVTTTNGKITDFSNGNQANSTLAEKLALIEDDEGAGKIGTNEVAFFEHGGNTYVYFENSSENVDNNTSSDSHVVVLTGVTGLTSLTETSAGEFTLA